MKSIFLILFAIAMSACSSKVIVQRCNHIGSEIWECEKL